MQQNEKGIYSFLIEERDFRTSKKKHHQFAFPQTGDTEKLMPPVASIY
jgi:hypothetical protein